MVTQEPRWPPRGWGENLLGPIRDCSLPSPSSGATAEIVGGPRSANPSRANKRHSFNREEGLQVAGIAWHGRRVPVATECTASAISFPQRRDVRSER